jgi:hypothetical protein
MNARRPRKTQTASLAEENPFADDDDSARVVKAAPKEKRLLDLVEVLQRDSSTRLSEQQAVR